MIRNLLFPVLVSLCLLAALYGSMAKENASTKTTTINTKTNI